MASDAKLYINKIEKNKRWNLHSGDDDYKTSFFLWFRKPSLNQKFVDDTYKRLRYTFKAYLWMIILALIYYLLKYYDESVGYTLCGVGLCILSLAYYLAFYNYSRLIIRWMMIFPLYIVQKVLIIWFNVPVQFAIPFTIIPTDIWTLINWRHHIMSNLIQLSLLSFWNSENISYKFDSLLWFQTIVIFWVISTFIFAVLEKLLKEFWVIRETSEKSFRAFLSVMRDCQEAKVIIDESLNIKFYNKKFEEIMKNLINNSHPNSMKESVHENSIDKFKQSIHICIKKQENSCSTVIFLNKNKETQG